MKQIIIIIIVLLLSACGHHYYYYNSSYLSKASFKRDFSTSNSNLHLINSTFWDFALVAGKDFDSANSNKYIMFCPWVDRSKMKYEYLNIDDVFLKLNVVLHEKNFSQFKNALDFIISDMSKSIDKKDGNFFNYNFFINLQDNDESSSQKRFTEIQIKYGKTEQGYRCIFMIYFWDNNINMKPFVYNFNMNQLQQLLADFNAAEMYLKNL